MKTSKYTILIFMIISMLNSCNIDDAVNDAVNNAITVARLAKKWKMTAYTGSGTTTVTTGTHVAKSKATLLGHNFNNVALIMDYKGSLKYTKTGSFLLKITNRLEGTTTDIVNEQTYNYSHTEKAPWNVNRNILILDGRKFTISEFNSPFKMLKLKVNLKNSQLDSGVKTETDYTIYLTFERVE